MKKLLAILFLVLALSSAYLYEDTRTPSSSWATVSSSSSRVQYSCNGSTKQFPFAFGVGATSEIQVILTSSAGVETILTETTHYDVSCINNDCSSGGTVTTKGTAYATGNKITVLRNVPITQESDFTEGMPTLYETFEDGLDKLTRIAQQFKEQLARTIGLPKSSTLSNLEFPVPGAGGYLRWNVLGTGIEAVDSSGIVLSESPNAPWVDSRSYSTLAEANTVAYSLGKTLLIAQNHTLIANTTLTATVKIVKGGGFTQAVVPKILTINGPFEAGLYQVFFGFSPGDIKFGQGSINQVFPSLWGLATTASDAVNSNALQCALDSLNVNVAGEVKLPPGQFNYSTGLVIESVPYYFKFLGSSGGRFDSGPNVNPDYGTFLTYTGTGIAIQFKDGRGFEIGNFHLIGNPNAEGGILLGPDAGERFIVNFVQKNMTISGFTKVGAYGQKVNDKTVIVTSSSYDVAWTNNYDGLVLNPKSATTIAFYSCGWPYNIRHGINATAGMKLKFDLPVFQGNGGDAIHGDTSEGSTQIVSCDLYGPYFELNNRLTAGYDIYLKGGSEAGIGDVNIYSPIFAGAGAFQTKNVYLQYTRGVKIHNPSIGGVGNTLTVEDAGNNQGFSIEPEHTTSSKVGAVLFNLLSLGNVEALWDFQGKSESQTTITDRSVSGHDGNLLAALGSRGSWKWAPWSITFMGGHYWDTPDHDDFSFGNGTTDSAFSIVTLFKMPNLLSCVLVAKYDGVTGNTQKEWYAGMTSLGYPYFQLLDDSSGGMIGRASSTPIILNTWNTVITTYSGSGLSSGGKIYLNGVKIDNGNAEEGSYTAMENKSAKVGSYLIVANGTKSSHFVGDMSLVSIIASELTATEAKQIDYLLRGYAGAF